jgi:hypothetical protein
MPKPSFAERVAKNDSQPSRLSNLNVTESRFSHDLFCELGFHRHFYQGREYEKKYLLGGDENILKVKYP